MIPDSRIVMGLTIWALLCIVVLFIALCGLEARKLRNARCRHAADTRTIEAQDDLIRERETDLFYANERNAYLEARQHLFPEAEA